MDSSKERWLSASTTRRVGDRSGLGAGAGRVLVLTGRVVKHSALSG